MSINFVLKTDHLLTAECCGKGPLACSEHVL